MLLSCVLFFVLVYLVFVTVSSLIGLEVLEACLAPRFGFVLYLVFMLVPAWVLIGRPVLSTAPPELLEVEYVGINAKRGDECNPVRLGKRYVQDTKGGRIATCGPDNKGVRRLGTSDNLLIVVTKRENSPPSGLKYTLVRMLLLLLDA